MRRLLCITAALALTGGSAFAHARLMSADPAQGATVTTAPVRLLLRFNEVPRLTGTGVELVGPDGHSKLLSPLRQDPADPRAVIAPMPRQLAPGRYQVHWRALSPDAHHTHGDFTFNIAGRS